MKHAIYAYRFIGSAEAPMVIPGVSVRAPGMSMGASAEPSAPKKKKKQKRHPGLPSQEGQEYYKSYFVHL